VQTKSLGSYIISRLNELKESLKNDITSVKVDTEKKYVIYISIGNKNIRANILSEINNSFENLYKNIQQKIMNYVRKHHVNPEWIKVDIVQSVKKVSFNELEKKISSTRRNYFRYGISFDNTFNISFLEQEINGNALIRQIQGKRPALNNTNINHYLKKKNKNHILFMKENYRNREVYMFKTKGYIITHEEGIIELYEGALSNGVRKIENIRDEVLKLICKSTYYLQNQIKENGKFEYGYFSAFAKSINTYNILRHASSIYAMLEGYEIIQDTEILEKAKRSIDYLMNTAIVYKNKQTEEIAFVVDYANEAEIKLGSNATTLLAMSKYMELTGDNTYLKTAQALARGIIAMKLPDSGFIHVLAYPDFNIKALNRIIYYEGEAIFSLLRLYAIDKKSKWLDEVKDSFEYFIKNEYWKHHDHWLSYAANELVIYEPKDKYFIFAMKNCNDYLDFIYHRETTFPTLLELTMAVYKLIKRIKSMDKEHLLKYIDKDYLLETIDRRAEFQRVGFFYPEQAMYMKNPDLILHGFFIRHHSFRVRIDDVEHYLSGYCQYYHYRLPDLVVDIPCILDD